MFMKKLLVIVAFFATVSGVQAQEAGRSNAIKINPLSLFLATGNVSYERAVSSQASVQLGAFYSSFGLGDLKYTGYGVTPEFRFYFAGHKEALNGVYVAPFARYQSFKLSEKSADNTTSFTAIGGGATIGWQKMWGSGFVLDIFAGPSYSSAKFKNESDQDEFNVQGGLTGFGVRTGITLGFGF
jgi:hypothetical protein